MLMCRVICCKNVLVIAASSQWPRETAVQPWLPCHDWRKREKSSDEKAAEGLSSALFTHLIINTTYVLELLHVTLGQDPKGEHL